MSIVYYFAVSIYYDHEGLGFGGLAFVCTVLVSGFVSKELSFLLVLLLLVVGIKGKECGFGGWVVLGSLKFRVFGFGFRGLVLR